MEYGAYKISRMASNANLLLLTCGLSDSGLGAIGIVVIVVVSLWDEVHREDPRFFEAISAS